jgi:hypothetical protein
VSFTVDLTELVQRLLQQQQRCPEGTSCTGAQECAREGGTCVASCPAGCCCRAPQQPQSQQTTTQTGTAQQAPSEFTVDLTELVQRLSQQQGPFYLAGGTDGRALRALASALDRLKSLGVQVPPPCRGDAYPVYVNSAAGSANAGSCIAEIRVPAAPDDQTALYHAYRALAMAARSALGADPSRAWYSEAVPETAAQHLTGRCGAARDFFALGLWGTGPYSAREELWGAYSASLLWALQQGRADVKSLISARPDALERIHADFLKALAASVPLCGSSFSASQLVKDIERVEVRAGSLARVAVSLDPLAAKYVLVSWPAGAQLRCAPPAGVECAAASQSPPAVVALVNVSPKRVEGETVLEAVAAGAPPGTGAPPTGGTEYTVDLTQLVQTLLGQTGAGPTGTATTATTTTTTTATAPAGTRPGEYTVDLTELINQVIGSLKSGAPNYTQVQQQGAAWQNIGGSARTGVCPQQTYLADRYLCARAQGTCVPGTEGDGTCCCWVQPPAPTAPTVTATAPATPPTAPSPTVSPTAPPAVERAANAVVQLVPLLLLVNLIQMLVGLAR